jgi:biotin carboxylase
MPIGRPATPKTLLVIGAGRLQVPAFTTGKRMGLRVLGVDRDPRAPGGAFADHLAAIDTHDLSGIVAFARDEHVDAVVTLCTDTPVRAVAAASHALGLSSLSIAAADVATHKGRMREAFAAAHAPIPSFRRVRSLEAATAAAVDVGLPAIVKPPATSGSRGVFKIDRMDLLPAAFARAFELAQHDEVLVEEFVEGPEVSVETLSFRGEHRIITITDKRTTGDPFWVETGHVEPSSLPDSTQASLRSATLAGLRALGIDNSASHVEIKIGKTGPKLIEIGARLGGDFITTELVPRSTGVDMVEAIIRIALGECPDWTPKYSKGAAISYITARPGLVTDISGTDAAAAMLGVVRLEVDVKVGDEVRPIESSLDRPGFVVAEGSDALEAERRASAAARRISIGIRGTVP